MLDSTIHKSIIDYLETNIIGEYDNDTLYMISSYILKRIEEIKKQLKEEEGDLENEK